MKPLRHSSVLVFSVLIFCMFCLASDALAQASCPVSPKNQTITICSPTDGATVGTTFHVNAGATDSTLIKYMQVYVANQLYATQHSNVLDATITVPPGSNQNLTVQFHDAANVVVKVAIHVTVSNNIPYTVSPQNPTIVEGATQTFTATAPTNWTSTCGSIDASGNFTAPLAQPKCTVTGKAGDGSGSSASTSVSISSPISISPSSASTVAGTTLQFTANIPVTWTASCGSIDGTGLFTAPASPVTCTVTATASGGTPYTASVAVNVTAAPLGSVNYTTWKNDNARDGLQPNETVLTPANVNASTFGQLFSSILDGWVWAQPLYMSGVNIGSAKHNVVYVATANDSVYAIDGDNGQQLWRVSLLPAGETPANGSVIHSSVPKVGITGTPVIDPATGTLYAVTQSVTTSGSNYYHRLHALDITTGAEKFGGPVVISPPGWTSPREMQRPGLLLANGNVYVAFGSNGDVEPYNGWAFAYNAGTLNQVEAWNVTPAGGEGGIWMAGSGIAADAAGNLYLSTGNGDWNGSTQFGQSIVKLNPTLDVLDYFTPFNHVQQSAADKDLGSGGILLLPDSTGPHTHEMISCGKLNSIFVLDRDNLGQIGASSDVVIQHVDGQLGATSGVQYTDRCFSTIAYWNNNLYAIGNNDVMKQFTLDPTTGLMSSTPVNRDTFAYLFPGGQPVVSANGNTNAIVWATDWTTGTLHAYDATNVSNVLYVSPKIGGGIKFTVPTVVNGHVYVGLQNKLVVMGLLPSGSCAAPGAPGVSVCAPTAGGTYSSPVAVSAAGLPASGNITRMELWIDGKKINDYAGGQIQTTVPLPVGSHAVTVVEVDSTGGNIKSTAVHIGIQ